MIVEIIVGIVLILIIMTIIILMIWFWGYVKFGCNFLYNLLKKEKKKLASNINIDKNGVATITVQSTNNIGSFNTPTHILVGEYEIRALWIADESLCKDDVKKYFIMSDEDLSKELDVKKLNIFCLLSEGNTVVLGLPRMPKELLGYNGNGSIAFHFSKIPNVGEEAIVSICSNVQEVDLFQILNSTPISSFEGFD